MILESFSAGYWIAPQIEVITYGGKRAAIQDDLFYELASLTGSNHLFGTVGGNHFELHPERSVPYNVVAIPEDGHNARNGDALLLSKQNGYGVFCYG